MSTPPIPLDYAPPLPFYKRRRFRRAMHAMAIMLGLLIVTFLGRHWIHGYYHRVLEYRAQRACMDYIPPSGQIAYSEEPATVAALATKADYHRHQNSEPPLEYIMHTPKILRDYSEHLFAHYSVLEGHTLLPGDGFSPMLYTHRVKTSAREEFLEEVCFSHHSNSELVIGVTVHAPETLFGSPKLLDCDTTVITLKTAPGQLTKNALRIYEAAPDSPTGMSFTTTYEIDGAVGHIRGEFKQGPPSDPGWDNFPHLTLEIVDGPLKP